MLGRLPFMAFFDARAGFDAGEVDSCVDRKVGESFVTAGVP